MRIPAWNIVSEFFCLFLFCLHLYRCTVESYLGMSVMRSHGFCRNPTAMDTDITYFCGMKTNATDVAGTPAGMQKKCRNEDTFFSHSRCYAHVGN